MQVTSHLSAVRKLRGLGASDLAQLAGVSRQTIYAVEEGSFVPNTAIALRLAGALNVTVEQLFALDGTETAATVVKAQLLSPALTEVRVGQLVHLVRVGSNTVAVPAVPDQYLPVADAVVEEVAQTTVLARPAHSAWEHETRLLIAGCDPALSLLADQPADSGIHVICVPCSSRLALQWLRAGLVHAAGSHLRDDRTGEYNLAAMRKLFGKTPLRVITFAHWEQGLVVAPGNPKRIRTVADLSRRGVRLINREEGSGSRDLLRAQLDGAGIEPESLHGWDLLAVGHMAAAAAIADRRADCCVANSAAARCFGLHFIPLASERFDLAWSPATLTLPAAGILLNELNSASLRSRLGTLAGYDTTHTGESIS